MRDKAKPPSKGLSSLSDKLKSLQTLIDNSKGKDALGVEDASDVGFGTQPAEQNTEVSRISEDSTKFDWQNIELTNELGTDFRSTLTSVVPLREGSIAPELDPENPELDHGDIPTLETVVYTPPSSPTEPKQTVPTPPSTDTDAHTHADTDESLEIDSKQDQYDNSELISAEVPNLVDDLSIPTLTDSVSPDQSEVTVPVTSYPSAAPPPTEVEKIDPIIDDTPVADAAIAHTVEFVGNEINDLQSPASVTFAQKPENSPSLPGLPSSSDVTDEILLIIENKLRETIGRTLHRDVLEELHEELYDLLTDWQDQLRPDPDSR